MQRVLVVDDEQLVADTLTLVFRKSGFDAQTAYSADSAMKAARELQPDLLLCDITMPGKDGHALVDQINAEFPACRIIVLTGFYSNLKGVRDQASRLSRPVSVMTKPCQPADLLREAAAVLASAS
jgi:CheY-like chemotaxis protein